MGTGSARRSDESGFALAAILFVTVVLAVTAASSLMITGNERIVSGAVKESAKTFYAAEAGLNEAVSGWAGMRYDTLAGEPGDSVASEWTRLANGCRYQFVVRRVDDGEGIPLWEIQSYGVGPAALGSQANVLTLLVRPKNPFPPRAILIEDDLDVPGDPLVLGGCPGIHVNDDIDIDGDMTVAGGVSASDDVRGSGSVRDTAGAWVTPTAGAPLLDIPDISPLDHCDEADRYLRDGWLVHPGASPADSTWVGSGEEAEGWSWNSSYDVYTLDGSEAGAGTVCSTGSIDVTNGPGSDGSPMELTLIARGFIRLGGEPFLTAHHRDGILFMAGSDLLVAGSAGSYSTTYDGLLYGGSQCRVEGSPEISGQLVCRDGGTPSGVPDMINENEIRGTPTIDYDCRSFLGGHAIRRIAERAWTQMGG